LVKRKCPKCDLFPTEDGQDPCITNLPNVEYACCGHGVDPKNIYAKFDDGTSIRWNTLEELKEHFNIK
jgi:hypothetical protein